MADSGSESEAIQMGDTASVKDDDASDTGNHNAAFHEQEDDVDAPNGSIHHGDPDDPDDDDNHVRFADNDAGEVDNMTTPAYNVDDHSVADTPVGVVMDRDEMDEYEMKMKREVMFFELDGEEYRIDYVLVYEENDKKPDDATTREHYMNNLREYDVIVMESPDVDISNEKFHYVFVHAPWDTLIVGAELMGMRKRLKMPSSLQKKLNHGGCCDCCEGCGRTSQQYIPDEGDYFTSAIHKDRLDLFEIGIHDAFFTNAERSLIVKEVLDRTNFTPDDADVSRFGISRLLQAGVYQSAFPLHEGRFRSLDTTISHSTFEGTDKDRALLYETWARPARWACKQPLELIRKYFGEKIGMYFSWLGYYTEMLIPAAVFGLLAFIYGIVTVFADPISQDICVDVGDTIMCPQCNTRCKYWNLKESCIYSKVTYVFDNYATIAFTLFMSLWAIFFLEFWKRKQYELQYEWDVQDFDHQERMRPEFEFKVKKKKENPITQEEEPYLTFINKCCRGFTSISIATFFALLVVAAILGVIIYRMVIVAVLYGADIEFVSSWAKIITSITASIINLIAILILGQIYRRVAFQLTNLELHRTESDFEDAYSFKMFLFQFANFYGTTFYIAFFKGKFQAEPGSTRFYLFGKFEPDACDPSGCMIDLLIQLFVVMVGKQALNQFKEIIVPKVCVCIRQRKARKDEASGGLYMRWMQDRDMQDVDRLVLFEEYLEMVLQYGFVTIFVAAFPLAPLFALLNNLVEIRLDAYKFLTQFKRPAAMKAQDIGVWYGILQSITFIAILTNSVIIAWTSDFIPRIVYLFGYSQDGTLNGYVNNSLSFFDTSNFTSGTAPDDPGDGFNNVAQCRFKGFLHPPGSERPYQYTQQFWEVLVARLAFIIVFEHCCFIVTYLVTAIIPDRPTAVRRLQTYEKALNRHLTFKSTMHEKRMSKRRSQNFGY